MGVLSDLEPERVFYYFEEISRIPRASYHEKSISDYLVAFAKEHKLYYIQDDLYNVIMFVPASAGYEQEEPLIMQGHMDMVCEKTADSRIDMEKEGLTLLHDDNYVYAKDTTLGGDDGIAIAYMLAIAESSEIAHPPLEMIITVSEEVGMDGANHIDLSQLKGHRMVNLDSEDEGVFLTSCAGGLSTIGTLPVSRKMTEPLCWYMLSVTGLLGGHSGCEIDKGRANANHILGRALFTLRKEVNYELYDMGGGKKDNAIPFHAFAVIGVMPGEVQKVTSITKQLEATLKAEYARSDAGITLELKEFETMEDDGDRDNICERMAIDPLSFDNILTLLMTLPNGVQNMSISVPGLVETSLNLGIMQLYEDHLFLKHAVRSSVTSKKHYVAEQIECLMKSLGGKVSIKGEYPAWEYREESVVRPKAVELYEKMYGKAPVVEGIHAGLECGLLAGKIENLDCIALGPDILDIHTTAERLDIASAKRVYEFLLEYLKQK